MTIKFKCIHAHDDTDIMEQFIFPLIRRLVINEYTPTISPWDWSVSVPMSYGDSLNGIIEVVGPDHDDWEITLKD